MATADNVVISQNENSFTIENGIISARVSKQSGNLISLTYKHLELLEVGSHSSGGYWSLDTSRGERMARITIDPNSNDGERGEVSIKGISDGHPMGSGPGGSVIADIEIRYTLARNDSGLYTYCILTHPTNYPATSVGEARFCAKLNDDIFDWMTVDSNRNMQAITAYDWDHGTVMNFKEARRMNTGIYNGRVEHKYDYAANQFDTPAWGWSSSANNVGIWFINPSMEYLSGGPTKTELCVHRDATFGHDPDAPAPPCLLNYWRSSHYGGSSCMIAPGEDWTKVIGPFLIYCDSARTHDAMWRDALKRSQAESKAWPYDWVEGVDYPHRNERGVVEGELFLHDPQAADVKMSHLLVGLSAPDYTISPNPQPITWQNDAKHYEFWTRGDAKGNFTIPNVRPGHYTLHAIADGVLGEFDLSNVTVSAGTTLKLGKLIWQPVRYGRQLWDIGIPNRTASEFFKGNEFFHWGWYLKYPKLFPNDVNYVIGQSDFHKDWFFEQVPHDENPADTNGRGVGRSTTWSIIFTLPEILHGHATLRLAICGVGARELSVSVNDHSIGTITNLIYNATINRDGIGGFWSEHDIGFDGSLLKAGKNVMKLTIPPGSLTSGIMYDYLRLEFDPSQSAK